jgi:rSAM/selenodomain-associated transferase 1
VIVMAKRPAPGRVKTRLRIAFDEHAAATIHQAMLECVLDRVGHATATDEVRHVLALDEAHEDTWPVTAPPGWEVVDQAGGDLGCRLGHVWTQIDVDQAVYFGVDSPDVPANVLRAIIPALAAADAAVGPVDDGGYWTLAIRKWHPALTAGIDWGTPSVYDQTRNAAVDAGLTWHELPRWYDVDTPDDLAALRRRLRDANDPALVTLRTRLDDIVGDSA